MGTHKTHSENGWEKVEYGIRTTGDVARRVAHMTGVTAGECGRVLFDGTRGVVQGAFRSRSHK